MIYTFKINTTNVDKLNNRIKDFCKYHDIELSKEHIKKLAHAIHNDSYMQVDEVQASSEDGAWDKVDDTRVIEELEITDVDCSDEEEREERARARYEAMQEDRYMDYVRGID